MFDAEFASDDDVSKAVFGPNVVVIVKSGWNEDDVLKQNKEFCIKIWSWQIIGLSIIIRSNYMQKPSNLSYDIRREH